jgi:hypothetical protein
VVLFEDGLFTFLSSDSGVQALVGTARGDGTKGVFPTLAPDAATLPYCVYVQVSAEPVLAFEGVNRFQYSRYRFSCYGATFKSAKQLARAIVSALNGFLGTWSNGIQIQGSYLELEAHNAEAVPHGTIYSTHVDFRFCWVDNDGL